MTEAASSRSAVIPESAPVDPSGAPLHNIARGGAANLVGAAVTAVAQLAITVLVTRNLSRESAGVFFSTTSLFLLAVVIGNLGANTGLVYFVSRSRALAAQGLIPAYLRTAFRPVMAVSIVLAVALAVFAPQVAGWANPDRSDEAAAYLRVLALFIPLASLESLAVAGARGMGSMRSNVVVSMVGRPVLQLGLVALVLAWRPALLSWSWSVVYLPAALVGLWWMRSMVRRRRKGGASTGSGDGSIAPEAPEASEASEASAPVGREFWSFSSARGVTSVIQIAMQRLDIVLVAALAGAGAAAVYAAATRFVVVGQMTNNALTLATQPRLAEAIAGDRHRDVNRIYQTSTAWLIALAFPLYLLLTVYGQTLLGVFGSDYHVGTTVVLLVSIAMLLSTAFGMVDTVLAMSGRTTWNLANAALALVVQVGLDVILIPRLGFVGAAVGWAASIVVRNVVALALVGFSLRLHPFGRSTAWAAAVNLVVFLGLPLGVRAVLGTGWLSFGVAVALAGSVYVGCLWLLRDTLDLAALRGIRRRR